jgi:hypothetical protein
MIMLIFYTYLYIYFACMVHTVLGPTFAKIEIYGTRKDRWVRIVSCGFLYILYKKMPIDLIKIVIELDLNSVLEGSTGFWP